MPDKAQMQSCPNAILSLARLRLAEIAKAHEEDKRPWLIRVLIPKPISPLLPLVFANIRHFSECLLEERRCAGKVMQKWLVDENKVVPIVDAPISAREGDVLAIEDPIRTLLFDFAFDRSGHKCVVVETDLSGNARRTAYELPEGVGGKVGVVLGNPIRERVERNWRCGD